MVFIVGQYLCITLQDHRVMGGFLREQFRQYMKVAPHITLYIFEHRSPSVEAVELREKVELQSKKIIQMEKTCNKLRSRVDYLIDKVNRLGNK